MDAHKLQLKIFLTPETGRALDLDDLIPVFHRWIKQHALPELTIDVANYEHVPKGPGVVLIGHGSDYFLDEGEGRRGLLHNRKRAGMAPGERLSDLARRTLHAALLLEKDLALTGKVRFATDELLFRINDRLEAPNTRRDLRRRAPRAGGAGQDALRRALRAEARRRRQGVVRGAHQGDDQPAAGDAARPRRRPARSRRVAGRLARTRSSKTKYRLLTEAASKPRDGADQASARRATAGPIAALLAAAPPIAAPIIASSTRLRR